MNLRSKALASLLLLSAAAAPSALAAGSYPYVVNVIVDGAPAPEYAANGRIYVEALKGRNFSLRLTNPTGERVAVALSVDGRNVIDAKRTTALAATKWILMPGQSAEIPGWQISGESSRRFFFTETRRSYAKWLGDTSNAGTIEAVFFREKRAVAVVPPRPRPWWDWSSRDEAGAGGARKDAPAEQAQSAPPPPSTREEVTVTGEAPASDPSGAERSNGAPSAEGRRKSAGSLAPSPKSKESDSYAATGIGDRTRFPVEWTSFDEDPTPAARVSLRYEFRAELVRLGVLPREDDLYARDRGRGFEREYAPDPYRGH